ncbi:hypothetical protein WT81_04800 [Burkholderia stagnalis]|uniref:hypothetical protein n=1 Tax=Burkholderia stagnalis TaxID=1503054 RepID=UPI00075FB54F|nr:hypothetical protein [Burkholderia stagnalis]KWK48083.1 hypothetical protein WT80_18890 [Burkholderia stagnalis]KWK66596.1 hypothetical protein WT81_04800 [Burkholderia stagnalis]
MKPLWAYVWEYTDLESGERRRTCIPVTAGEFFSMTGQFLPDSGAHALEETKVDRNVVPARIPDLRRAPKMPEFDAPSDAELREMWRMHRDPEVRRLILEIVMLRKSLQKVMDWWESCDRVAQDKGELGGPHGPFHRLLHLLRDEMRRTGMY